MKLKLLFIKNRLLNQLISNGFLLILIAGSSFVLSCRNLKEIKSRKEKLEISFGKSGGFTNIPLDYRIDSSGAIYKIKGDDSLKAGFLSKRDIRKIREMLSDSDFEHLEVDDPGNITYYISVMTDEYQNTVRWNDQTADELPKEIYKELLNYINP